MQPISTYVNNRKFIKKVQFTLIVLFILLIALDIYLALDKTKNNTISNVIQNYTDNGLFVLTYFWGALAANIFFTRKSPPLISPLFGTIIVVTIAILMVLFNIEPKVSTMWINIKYNLSVYSISMTLGFLVGLIFWRQEQKKLYRENNNDQ